MSDTLIVVTYDSLDSLDLADYSMAQGELQHYTTDRENLTITLKRSEVETEDELNAFEDVLSEPTVEGWDPDGEMGITAVTVTEV